MEFSPDTLPWNSLYKIMIGSILPRPIGWISSIDMEGRPNLAPFSFFNAVCANPPTILFCPMVRGSDLNPKDTLNNVRSTGEFVANIVTEELALAMNVTSTEFPAEIDEFRAAGLTPVPSVVVRPFRVGESPIHYECRVTEIVDLGEQSGGGSIVIGRIVHLHVSDEVLIGGDKIDLARLKPIGRLAGSAYCRVTDVFEMVRPPSQIKTPSL
ncbi:MAG: flavin reductase family protein [Chloroflexota bacterium]|nr:MAG: flavin reductase family protein [Chloroflexota bacterium]